jgi:hypothetical protein
MRVSNNEVWNFDFNEWGLQNDKQLTSPFCGQFIPANDGQRHWHFQVLDNLSHSAIVLIVFLAVADEDLPAGRQVS